MFSKLFVLAAAASGALAMVTPTSPDSTTVVKVGEQITAMWTPDPTGTWTDMEIQLMTGPNSPMVELATVGTGIDGTTATSYSFAAPDVTPYSKIYFLQFTNGGDMTNVTWVTRFTIAGPNGETTDPTDSTTDSTGQTVQWGTGALVDSNSTISGSVGGNASATPSGSASASASTSHSGLTLYNTDLPTASVSGGSDESPSASAAAASVSASASAKSGGAGALSVGGGMMFGVAGVALAALL